jgi:C4-type Zn-finger protein
MCGAREIVEYCPICGGDGEFSVEATFDPFSGRIGYRDYVCPRCRGARFFVNPLEQINQEDLAMMAGDDEC